MIWCLKHIGLVIQVRILGSLAIWNNRVTAKDIIAQEIILQLDTQQQQSQKLSLGVLG